MPIYGFKAKSGGYPTVNGPTEFFRDAPLQSENEIIDANAATCCLGGRENGWPVQL